MEMYDNAFEKWITEQVSNSKGERRRRLETGLGHAEKLFLRQIWWHAVGSFEFLHAEYEVRDFLDGSRFLDTAYIRPPYLIDWEVDGFGPHARDLDRRSFADGLKRQNHLILDGWKIFRFSYDDIQNKPRQCQQFVQQVLGRLYAAQSTLSNRLSLKEREIVQWAQRRPGPIRVHEVCEHLKTGQQSTRSLLHAMAKKNILIPTSGVHRIHAYQLAEHMKELLL